MKPISRRAALRAAAGLIAAFFALMPGLAAAQSDWKATWDKTLAAAKAEGALTILVPPGSAHRDFVAHAWATAHPEITLSMSTSNGPDLMPRFNLERGADKFLWDIVMTGSENGFRLRDAGYADPMVPEFVLPDVADPKTWGGWDAAFMDKEHKYVFTARSYLKLPYFNAKLLDPAKVKRLGAKIFLDPQLKGKVIWHDPLLPGSGRTFAPVLLRLLGEDGLKKFVTEQAVFTPNQMDAVDRMARGQFLVSLGPVITGMLERYTKAGVDLDIRALGNTPELGAYANTGASNLVVINKRPHPNATRVFLNWYLSKDVMLAMAKATGEDSRREDVPETAPPDERRVPGVKYWEAQREEYAADVREAQAKIKAFRGVK
jgi:ABC-type Fe3+ transport system substrate-binding protein